MTVTYESELENAMAMSAQGIIRTLREGGEQADVTSSQVSGADVARLLCGVTLLLPLKATSA